MIGVAVRHLNLADVTHKLVDLNQVLAECWLGKKQFVTDAVAHSGKKFPANFLHRSGHISMVREECAACLEAETLSMITVQAWQG